MSLSMGPLSGARRAAWITLPLGAIALALALPSTVVAQEGDAAFVRNVAANEITFSSDVAAIVFENCAVCHRPGGIAPMPLTSYEEVKPFARMIAGKVARREMPPYAYDHDVGIQNLVDDWRLSQQEINTIVAWVENGAPLGDAAKVPPVVLADLDKWNFEDEMGKPDLIVKATPIDVPARGNDMWHRPYVPTGLTEDRCIKAIQVKPAGNAKTVVHHANTTFQIMQPDGKLKQTDRLSEYAMGKIGERIPEGVCRIAPANSYVLWDIHLYPGGIGATAPNAVIEDNEVEIGIWLHPKDYKAPYKQDLAQYGIDEGTLVLPPHGTTMTQGHYSFDHPVRIDSFQPHGHLRLRHASLEIYYPETRETVPVSMISNWSAQWHHSHIYAPDEAPLLPAGAVLVMKQWYDNTADNPNNPDPDMWVDGGSRTADEMDHAWIAVTHLDQAGYEKLLAERKAKNPEATKAPKIDAHRH